MNGLLASLFSTIDSKKRQLNGLLSNPVETLSQGVRNFVEDQNKLLALQSQAYPWTGMAPQEQPNQLARKLLADQGAAQGMAAATVWHGSPHKFDKFDSSKIGTGEGAQAYGHGLYLAESPDVAKDYALRLSKNAYVDTKPEIQAAFKDSHNAQMTYLNAVLDKANGKKIPAPIDDLRSQFEHASERYLNAVKEHGPQTYKVDLPDEHIAKMINLDAAIEQAPAAVQEYYKRNGAFKPGMTLNDHMAIDSRMAEEFSKKGIPGVRYLDGGSRGAGGGTSNFVIFPGNEGLLSILERNGQALK